MLTHNQTLLCHIYLLLHTQVIFCFAMTIFAQRTNEGYGKFLVKMNI